jgi:hypothetical protein
MLALGAPVAAFAAGSSIGNSAIPSKNIQSVPETRGSVDVAENTGEAARPNGNALATQAPFAQYLFGDNVLANVGNGAQG